MRSYQPRRPTETTLHQVVEQHLPALVDLAENGGRVLPGYVLRELEDFLACGQVSEGFTLLRCPSCSATRVLPFSCQRRGFCPSCGGRQMAETAAHLVERVLPDVRLRQWVLTLPYPLRCRLAWDPPLCGAVLRCFIGVIRRFYERQVPGQASTGAVTVIQFCGQDLSLNVHFHSLLLEGAYTWDAAKEQLCWHPLTPPSNAVVQTLVDEVARRVEALLRRGDATGMAEEPDEDDALRQLQAFSAAGREVHGPRAGRKPRCLQGPARQGRTERLPQRCARRGYYNLHANTSVAPRDRDARERLCRYVARPPLATERLSVDSAGRVVIRFKRAFDDGRSAVLLDPLTFVGRLASLVARPGFNRTRYHGVFAPNHPWRADVVPLPPRPPKDEATGACAHPERARAKRWTPWAQLLARVLSVDGLACPSCGTQMQVHAVIMGRAIARVLASLSRAPRGPPTAS